MRESTPAMGGENARAPTASGRKAARTRAHVPDGHTREMLYAEAQRRKIEGRSRMTKAQLKNELGVH